MAEIAAFCAAVPNTDVAELGTNRKSYRCKVSIQIGDTTQGSATTTLQDTNVTVIFDSTRTITISGLTNTYIRLGTKVGSGEQASGVDGCDITLGGSPTWPRQSFVYGSTLRQTSGAFIMVSTDGVSEAINNIYQSSVTSTAPFSMGQAGLSFDNVYNIDISHKTSGQVLANWLVGTARRITIAAASPTTFMLSGATGVSMKDAAFFGTPTQSDLRFANSNANTWTMVRPQWSGNAPKFSSAAAFSHTSPDLGCVEYWLYDVKVVDGGTGSGISGIPVKLTDNVGNVVINTTTDSTGQISFGSGITESAVAVMDHYSVSGVYTQRHRSPFLLECNMPTMSGYNSNYLSRRRYFDWPGKDTITTTSGTFEDMNDIIVVKEPSGQPTSWTECSL